MIAPAAPAVAKEGIRFLNSRTITRTASQSRLLSLGSCISAAVTVLSSRTTRPSSSCPARAPASNV